jgi:hypothetical protein
VFATTAALVVFSFTELLCGVDMVLKHGTVLHLGLSNLHNYICVVQQQYHKSETERHNSNVRTYASL